MKGPCLTILLSIFTLYLSCTRSWVEDVNSSWEVYGGSKANIHYSSLDQINRKNVSHLEVAWEYHSGDKDSSTQIQVNPIVVDGMLYGVSPKLKLFALNAATGEEQWVFDPVKDQNSVRGRGYFQMNVCRGVTYYKGEDQHGRLFYSANSQLFSIRTDDGQPDLSFGDNGRIDLHNDLGREVRDLYVASTTPGIIYKDMIIVGTRVSEGGDAAPGHIRAYDVNSGTLRWIFHTIPHPDEQGFESWADPEAYKHIGGANSWAGFSLDEEKGILYAPTGSASYDFYGGMRKGSNLFANSVLAIRAESGKLLWYFQTVHHDVWDRDLPSAPALVTVNIDGRSHQAAAQITKSGFIFLLDRTTGKPLYPINEQPVPQKSHLNDEQLSPTQPVPEKPVPFARQLVTKEDLNDLIPDSSYQLIRDRFNSYLSGNIFQPPSPQGTVIMPGFDGGGEWGGAACDPETSIMYINASEMPWILTMVETGNAYLPGSSIQQAGEQLYRQNCMSCHGSEMQGGGNYPTLKGIDEKYTKDQLNRLITSGRRMMPAFALLSEEEKSAISSYVLGTEGEEAFHSSEKADPYRQLPYTSTGYHKFETPEGYPAIKPPWGTLNAVDLNTGNILWKKPLGNYPEVVYEGDTGSESYGGPVVTAGGLVFIAATRDEMFRVFDKKTGEMLWKIKLPAAGYATPAVYEVDGKQYVTIACGGGKLHSPSGDSYVTFTLAE